jgi:hypothetical protein
MAGIGAGRLTEAEATAVTATARVVEPSLGDRERIDERAAWRSFVPRAVALASPPDIAAG